MARLPLPAAGLADQTLQADLDALTEASLDDLRVSYRRLTRKTAPPGLPRWLLQRIVAYRMQAMVFGDLDAETARYLDRIVGHKAKGQAGKEGGSGSKAVPAVPRALRPGTQLVREYDGELHRVTVLADGFGWNGSHWSSLSEIARTITGTNWNGPAFFGLRKRSGSRGKAPAAMEAMP